MTTRFDALTRPTATTDHRVASKHRTVGFGLAFVGLMLVAVTLIANIAAANTDSAQTAGETLAWSFGLTTLGFGTIKLAISIILIGILVRLWLRVTAVRESLPGLKTQAATPAPRGEVDTAWGAATETSDIPAPLPVHRMARTIWFPMIAMGYMLVIVGTIFSFVWASKVGDGTQQAISAWTQGTQFLGEGMLLAGVSYLLGSILGALRGGGGDIQNSLGLPVRTLKMPVTAKLLVGFMMLGLVLAVVQFVLYIATAVRLR